MILLVLVVVLWILVLTPSAYRRFTERSGAGSIDHFQHQLNLLEHAGPKLVTPAYRLHTALPGGSVGVPSEAERSSTYGAYGAKLVLLRPVDDEQSADIDDFDGAHYERVGVLDPPQPPRTPDRTREELQAYRRQEARRRCSNILLVLTGLTISTAVLGVLPALRPAWILTALTGLAVLGIIGLVAYAREIEAQRERRHDADDPYPGTPVSDVAYHSYPGAYDDDSYPGAAESGYPGAWDDQDDVPRRAAAGR